MLVEKRVYVTKMSLDRTRRLCFAVCVGHTPKKPIDVKMLSRWNLIDDFRRRLGLVRTRLAPAESRGGPERKLLEEDYFSLFLFGLLNPVVDSMRGLCAASKFGRVQKQICSRPVSLGSFSEAQAVFDPDLLKEVFMELAAEVCAGEAKWGDSRLAPWPVNSRQWTALYSRPCPACSGRCGRTTLTVPPRFT